VPGHRAKPPDAIDFLDISAEATDKGCTSGGRPIIPISFHGPDMSGRLDERFPAALLLAETGSARGQDGNESPEHGDRAPDDRA
jgi:hypothetical protein